jgi:hypothetical protein
MGYATNQFENFTSYEGPTKDLKRTIDDNPNFIYPENRVPDIYNPITGDPSRRYTVDTKFQRGFIRGIYPAVLGGTSNPSAAKVKQRRLFFQFNPATIDRSVSMNSETMMPLLQDPGQMFQPINGNAQFSFELLFDRQAEVVMSEYRDNDGNLVTGATLSGSLDNYGANWQQSNVSDLGVLADLYVLDSIIGQSITPDMTSFLKEYWNYVDKAVTSYNATDVGASANNTTQFDAANFEKNASLNYGNSAFLSPLPIRIVFSSLFMVEGFVTASSVQFMKFTKNYVPTVCRVALDIKAMYIGFAREKSYLTDTLSKAVAEQVAQKDAAQAVVETATTLSKDAIRFKYGITSLWKRPENMQGISYDSTFSTFSDFFSASGYDDNLLTFEGPVDSYVFKSLSEEVKKGAVWSFASALQIFEYAADIKANDIPKESGWYGKKIFQSFINFDDLGKSSVTGSPFNITNEKMANETNKKTDSTNPSQHVWRAIGKPNVKTIGANSIILFKIKHSITTSVNVQGTITPITSYVEDDFTLIANSTTDWTTWLGRQPTWFLPKTNYTGAYQ